MGWSVLSLAQIEVADALRDSLSRTTDPRQKVDILNALAESCLNYDLDSSLANAARAKTLGLENDYYLGVAHANKWLGKGNSAKGLYSKALGQFMDALTFFKKQNDTLQMAEVYKNLGNIYLTNDNHREGKRYYDMAMALYGGVSNTRGQIAILNNMGTMYLRLGDADSALHYLNQARLANLEIKNDDGLSYNYTNMGFAYALKNDYNKAIDYYRKSYDLAVANNNRESVAAALLNIGDGYMNLGDYEKAEDYVRQGLAIANQDGYKFSTYIGYYTLGEINEKKGTYKESVKWYKEAQKLHDELHSSETLMALMDVQTRQLEEAQAREIERINAINAERIQSEKLKNLLYLSTAIFALVVLLGLTYFYMKRHKTTLKITMQNKEINEQKEKIEAQSKKIKQVNSTLRERNKKLRELNEEKNYMMSVVAHDLKSPLNQINGLASVIKLDEDRLTDTQKECLDNIAVASGRLSEMINKILDSRNFDRNQDSVKIEPIDIDKMATDVLNDFSATAGKKNITLHKNSRNGAKVMADKHYLRQVFDNLVSNAIKFSPEGTNIELNITHDGDKILAEVKDEGPGITPEDKEKLFTEYAVLSAKPTGGETSTGLGLAIVKNYVEKIGGEIWCESEPGQGASFKVKLDPA